jgi:predicted nucleotidyltransferase
MGKNEVIDIVRKYKEMVLSTIGPASVYLYGSYSKGSAREDSDIDVAVVVPEVNGDFIKVSAALWGLTWDLNTLIEPVLIDARYPSPLYADILQTGVLV